MSFPRLTYASSEVTILHANTALASNKKTEAPPIARISTKIDFAEKILFRKNIEV